MTIQRFPRILALLAVLAIFAGCGSAEDNSTRRDVVITPAEQPAAEESEEPADEPADEADDAVAATETPAESATEEETTGPEMEDEESSTEVASAETPEESETPEETTAAKPAEEAPAEESAADAESAEDKGTTYKGRVVVKGEVPTIPPIKPSGNDAYCIDLGEIPDDEVIIGEEAGLANVFVWVRRVPSGVDVPEPPEEPAVLDQKGCRFIPPALAVQVGQPFLVKNDDATLHNTRLTGLGLAFNQTVGPNNREGIEVSIRRPEAFPVPVKCDIHNWMSARVLVTDNPWYAITDENGNFEINNLPAGVKLEFRLQHAKGYVKKSEPLTFTENEVRELSYEMDAEQLTK